MGGSLVIRFLDLQAQYQSIRDDIDSAIAAVIANSAFVGGPHVAAFEEQFARYAGAAHCVGVGNGTDALEIAIEALALPPGSEIIVPGNSFIASAEAVSRCGHRVVFADVHRESYVLDVASVQAQLTPRTKALVAVHLYGHPCDMDALMALAREHGLAVIEDCAQAHGAEVRGQRVGGLGDVGCFSFYPGKNLGAYGDAGAITTQRADLAQRCRMIANHGRLAKHEHEFEGRNSRLDGLQAAVLSAKLPHLGGWTEHRIAIADHYLRELAGVGDLVLPVRQPWARQVYHLFVVRTARRDALMKHLAEHGIETGRHYPVALPKLRAYRYLGEPDLRAFCNRIDATLLSLPIGEHMTLADAQAVVSAVRLFYREAEQDEAPLRRSARAAG
ncbi:DegT/DnrJ/EryC1/StrS aminotransferase family protein [Piscinibacter sp. HJYY11]|uniref:DegT/DnrJ/EryC1/StrS family aminotransferase n=1 Tax=Piscinibacter sp. HJYY11 TaxID=2801333 RepID=UPI00191FDD75|nr:DegT/DnrJ/EryC1/StrS family aminotransferase [Piscinibacter sp. HJYY11]MBL0727361.1 DegT/DnrJ/EryC1/StrS family aminotransferase [Piscinibacter sp. HJYY11]